MSGAFTSAIVTIALLSLLQPAHGQVGRLMPPGVPGGSIGPPSPAVDAGGARWTGFLGTLEGRVQATLDRATRRTLFARTHFDPLGPPLPGGSPGGDAIDVRPGAGGVGVDQIPTRLWFGPLVPNPSPGHFTLRFDLPGPAHVQFAVLDVAGRVVHATSRYEQAGRHSVSWDARSLRVRPGVYFVRMDVDHQPFATQRLVLIF